MDSRETYDIALGPQELSQPQDARWARASFEGERGPLALSRTSTLDKQYVRASVKRRRAGPSPGPGSMSPGARAGAEGEHSLLLAPSSYARTAAPLVRSTSLTRSLDERVAAPTQDLYRPTPTRLVRSLALFDLL